MKIMKKYLFFAAAITLMVGCADDNIVNNGIETPVNGELRPITFGSYTTATTRADFEDDEAAALLGNNFVVEGVKWDGGSSTKDVVFDHYNVNWVDKTANTTTSNTDNWEYVGQAKHAFGPTGNQVIKYWDYAKSQYDFIAYSKGTATAVYADGDYDKDANVQFTEITPSTLGTSAYTVKGKASELAKVYIADMVTIYRGGTPDYQSTVQFKFRSLSAKVRIALYEIVPGYSVKDVVFYSDAATPAATASTPTTTGEAYLFTTGSYVFNDEGTYTVYYPTTGSANTANTDYNKAHLSFEKVDGGTKTVKSFGKMDDANPLPATLTNFVGPEGTEASDYYLGRSSNTATYAGDKTKNYYTVVIPNETATELNLKVNYTLVSTDGSGETIHVTGATAKVPAIYGSWKSGYAYTYIFKISQNGNGKTNPEVGPEGLYPITFDAVVMNSEADGIQETITTVANPSITTYAKGEMVTKNNEYLTGANIYVVVENGTALTVGTNAKLYTVTLEAGAAQTINEASVANAIKNGGASSPYEVTDANGKKMTVTDATGLTAVTSIAAADAPDGNAITINGAKFTPATPTFATVDASGFVNDETDVSAYYTRSGDAEPYVYTKCAAGAKYATGTTYYNKTATTAGTYVFEYKDASNNLHYKIIKVVDKD